MKFCKIWDGFPPLALTYFNGSLPGDQYTYFMFSHHIPKFEQSIFESLPASGCSFKSNAFKLGNMVWEYEIQRSPKFGTDPLK